MSTNTYAILQQWDEGQKEWISRLSDCLQFMSTGSHVLKRKLEEDLSIKPGLPEDLSVFEDDEAQFTEVHGENVYLGCYGHYCITIEQFCKLEVEVLENEKTFTVNSDDDGLHIVIPNRGSDYDYDEEETLRNMQYAFASMFCPLSGYRLIIGFG